MQTLQTPSHSPHVSSSSHIPDPWSIELSVRDAREQTGSRHDAHMLTRALPADPYTLWLEERERGRRTLSDRHCLC